MNTNLKLSQRVTQTVALSPLLQHSLLLLQTPHLELNTLITKELEMNPALELAEGDNVDTDVDKADLASGETGSDDSANDPAAENADPENNSLSDFVEEFARMVEAEEGSSEGRFQSRLVNEDEERRQFIFDSLTTKTSFVEALQEQVRDSALRPDLYHVADLLIGNIGDDGYLSESLENLACHTGVSEADLKTALAMIQTFDPPGVGARNLQECLLLQLERAGRKDSLEYIIVRDFMEPLSRRRLEHIAKKTHTYLDEVQDAIEIIAKLNPRPNLDFSEEPHYVAPEIFVEKQAGEFTVRLAQDHIRPLRISPSYKRLMSSGNCPAEVVRYIRDKIRDGKLLLKNLNHRQMTIQRVAEEIVKHQSEFMEKGPAYLKPLKMADVANAVGVHETTVSRTVSGKFVQTPHGVFELRQFFARALITDAGEISNRIVQDRVVALLENEDPCKPLTDHQIVQVLKAEGIKIARRTVSKYRFEKGILSSHLRRTIAA